MRLSRVIPKQNWHRVFFDNYYTSIPLMEYLYKDKILALGTVRLNRLPNNKQPDKSEQSKMIRGSSIEHISSYGTSLLSIVKWKDNKAVSLLSTFCGELPKSTVQRFNRKEKKRKK